LHEEAMMHHREPIPTPALALAAAAVAVPMGAALLALDANHQYEILLWLFALVPAFLFAYYRGWNGAAAGTLAGILALAVPHASRAAAGQPPQDLHRTGALLVTLVVVAIGVGWLAERLLRERHRARQLALVDDLTGLPNRRHLEIFLRSNFAAAKRGRNIAVVLFDIDHFKNYNDDHGHGAGDAALRDVASVMRTHTRAMDLCGRWGGEEFLAVLTAADPAGAMTFAQRVRDTVEHLPIPHPVTISGGIAPYDSRMLDPEELVHAADRALYQAKVQGRNRIAIAAGDALGSAASAPALPHA
jgi:diguanylate cyclase (GGDEF)-like protein